MANDFLDAFAAWLFAPSALTADSIGTNTLTAYGSIGAGAAIQGAPSVAFNGSSKYLGIADANLAAGFPFKDGDTGKLITVCYKLRLVTTDEVPMAGKLAFGTAQSFGLTWSSNPFFEADGGYYNSLGLPPLVNGHEYQIIYTIDGDGKKFSIYSYDYTAALGGFINHATSNVWTGSTLAFLIGRDVNRNYAYGEMGEIVVFNRILTISEMNAIKDGNYSSSFDKVTEFAPHDLTSPTSHSPFVVSSSDTYPGFDAFKAFDGQFDIYHNSLGNTGEAYWLKLDIGSGNAKKLFGYCVQVDNYPEPNRAPKNWTMEGSNDDSVWDTLDTRINQTSWGSGETRFYVCDTYATEYRYLRLNITANNGDSYTQVAELYLYAPEATPGLQPATCRSATTSAAIPRLLPFLTPATCRSLTTCGVAIVSGLLTPATCRSLTTMQATALRPAGAGNFFLVL